MISKTESMAESKAFQKNLAPLMSKSICKPHKRQSFSGMKAFVDKK